MKSCATVKLTFNTKRFHNFFGIRFKFKLGATMRSQKDEFTVTESVKVKIHEQYNAHTFENDIALMKMKDKYDSKRISKHKLIIFYGINIFIL